MAFSEKTFYRALCDRCKAPCEDSNFDYWYDEGQASEAAVDAGWFARTKLVRTIPADDKHPFPRYIYDTVELICDDCKTCDVCGAKFAYEVDDHLVCEEHEDHVFVEPVTTEPAPAIERV